MAGSARSTRASAPRFGAYALYRRAAEAVTVRAAATDLLTSDHEASLMVLGDLNDEVEAATTQILNGPTGSESGTGGFNQPDHGDRQRLWNLAPRIPEAQRFSRKYRGRKELIDHIFVSHALVGKIAQDHVITDAAGPTPSIDDDPTKSRGAPDVITVQCSHRSTIAGSRYREPPGARHNRIAPRGLVMAFSGCLDGLFSAHVGDRGWLRPLPLRGEPLGAALTLRTQHSPGSPPISPACDEEGSGRLSAIGGNGRIGS